MLPLEFLKNASLPHDVVDIKTSTLASIALKCKDTTAALENCFCLTNDSVSIQALSAKYKMIVIGIRDLYNFIHDEYTVIQAWAETAAAASRKNISVEEFTFLYQKLERVYSELQEIHDKRISTLIPSGATQFALIISENQIHQSSRLLLEQFVGPVFEAYQQKIMKA